MAGEQINKVADVWAVVFGNYSPTQVDSLWTTQVDAEKALEGLDVGGMWRIERLPIQEIEEMPADAEPQAQPDEGESLREAPTMAGAQRSRRGFYWASESWHATTTLSGDTVDALSVGMYYAGGGCDFEICLEWVTIGLTPTLKVCVYSDGLRAFTQWPDLFTALARLDGTHPQPERVVALLRRLGFADMTQREKPKPH